MKIILVLAKDLNSGIGIDNKLPWRIPTDLQHFKKTTLNQTIVMGRKTLESLPGLLPGRSHCVVTRDRSFYMDGVSTVHSIEESIEEAQNDGLKSIFVVGGAEIYSEFLGIADKIIVSEVQTIVPDCNKFFPKIDDNCFELVGEEYPEKSEKDEFSFIIKTYERKSKS